MSTGVVLSLSGFVAGSKDNHADGLTDKSTSLYTGGQ